MSKQKPLYLLVEKCLKDAGSKPDTVRDFKALYGHVEKGYAIPDELLTKFEKLGLYHKKTNQITDPENDVGLILQALMYEGMVEMKRGKKIFSLEKLQKEASK